ncbi:cell division cycle protein 48 [Heliomicrobium modesticaldum Ice1]|uniref:Cell division cycle protein 48 n=1 Tax=Heliobacterium modesticaldum (strain ATCC 51547 / Ice1) TaxID=498761 RepID=B0TBE7_HELMI|nr:AAA family ATPase [Heliomicrobium modesticaldum]ABZ85160.1 cell division cycle protein 48 [Heliomicrobium modesticaldum Ice1]
MDTANRLLIEFHSPSPLASFGLKRQFPAITKGDNGWYRIAFTADSRDQVQLCEFWKKARRWEIRRISASGKAITSEQLDKIVTCLEQRQKVRDAAFYCDGRSVGLTARDERALFFPGCRFLIVDDVDWSDPDGPRWYRHGAVDGDGFFHTDKAAVLAMLEQLAQSSGCAACPALDWQQIARRVSALPDTINPRKDGTWEYRFDAAGTTVTGIIRTPPERVGNGRFDMDTCMTSVRVDESKALTNSTESRPVKSEGAYREADLLTGTGSGSTTGSSKTGSSSSDAISHPLDNPMEDFFRPVKPGKVTYADVGGLKEELRLLREAVELPLRYPDLVRTLNITPPKGVLLYGPPGCGKTLLAQAVANEVEATFFAVKGPEFLSSLHGQSEKRLRDLFAQAEKKAPSIIFFDEIDAFAFDRSRTTTSYEATLVAQFLSLMDGFDRRAQVVVIATTNRLDVLDKALLRPGRFDYRICVTVPTVEDRLQIFKLHTAKMPLEGTVNINDLAEQTKGFTGADIAALCAKAALMAVARALGPDMDRWPASLSSDFTSAIRITGEDFAVALTQVRASVNVDDDGSDDNTA